MCEEFERTLHHLKRPAWLIFAFVSVEEVTEAIDSIQHTTKSRMAG